MTRAAGASPAESVEGTPISVLEVVDFLRRHFRVVVGCALVACAIASVILLVRDRKYTSSASFFPQASDKLSSLAGLAAQFGVMPTGPDASESPAFYADLLRSREVLTTVLEGQYRTWGKGGPQTAKLIDLLKVRSSTEARRVDKGIEKLSKSMRVEQKSRTGVVSLAVQMPRPELAQQVTQRFLDELGRFGRETRNSRAAAERRFTEGRLADIRRELREAEDRLQLFLQSNRDYRNSPSLSFQRDRLSQEVDFLRNVLTTVAQANEKARMDEVRDTPVITVIDRPNMPAKPDGRGLVKYGTLALILGGIGGLAIAWIRETLLYSRAMSNRDVIAGRHERTERAASTFV